MIVLRPGSIPRELSAGPVRVRRLAAGTGVTATASCPSATATEFATIAGAESAALFKGMADLTEVASHSYRAMTAGKTIAIPGMKDLLSIQSLRLCPRSMTLAVAARLNRP